MIEIKRFDINENWVPIDWLLQESMDGIFVRWDEVIHVLSEQDYQYNKQTNELIARHATQIKMLEQQNLALIEQLVEADLLTPRTFVIDASDGAYRFNGFEFTQE